MANCDEHVKIVINSDGFAYISRVQYSKNDNVFIIDDLKGHPRDSMTLVVDSVFGKMDLPGEYKYKLLKQLPRPSSSQEGMVAYYENEEKKNIQRLSVIKPGRYLRKYLIKDNGDQFLSDTDIEKYANLWISNYSKRKLHILTRSEDIVDAYTKSGINSCMSYDTDHFASRPYHPVEVYGTKDGDDTEVDTALAVIYADEDDLSPSNIIARCVIWPEKKIKTNTYGDYHKLNNLLSHEGYETGSFDGARMRHIESDKGTVCPYFDFSCGAKVSGKNLIASSISDGGESQNGLLYNTICVSCDDSIEPGDERYNDYGEVFCEHCFDETYFYCDVTDEYHHIDNSVNVNDAYGGKYISERGIQILQWRNEIFYCCFDNEYYLTKEYDYIIDHQGDTYESDNFYNQLNGIFCGFTEEYYADPTEIVELSNKDGEVMVCHESIYGKEDEYVKWLCDNDYVDERFSKEMDEYKGQLRLDLEVEKEGELL